MKTWMHITILRLNPPTFKQDREMFVTVNPSATIILAHQPKTPTWTIMHDREFNLGYNLVIYT